MPTTSLRRLISAFRQPEGNGCVERFIRNRTPAQVRAEQLGTLAATA